MTSPDDGTMSSSSSSSTPLVTEDDADEEDCVPEDDEDIDLDEYYDYGSGGSGATTTEDDDMTTTEMTTGVTTESGDMEESGSVGSGRDDGMGISGSGEASGDDMIVSYIVVICRIGCGFDFAWGFFRREQRQVISCLLRQLLMTC